MPLYFLNFKVCSISWKIPSRKILLDCLKSDPRKKKLRPLEHVSVKQHLHVKLFLIKVPVVIKYSEIQETNWPVFKRLLSQNDQKRYQSAIKKYDKLFDSVL